MNPICPIPAEALQKYINGTGLSNIIKRKNQNIDLKYLLAILNSKVINYWFNFYFVDVNIKPEQLRKIPIKIKFRSEPFIKIVDYILYLKSEKTTFNKLDLVCSHFEQIIDDMVFELYFEEEIKRAGRDILKYLTKLTPITKDMSEEQKLNIITRTYNELSNPNHPVRQNLDGMDEIEEVRIIKGLDK